MDKTAERVHNQTIDFVNKAYEELSTIAHWRKDLRYFNKDYNDVSIDENISNMFMLLDDIYNSCIQKKTNTLPNNNRRTLFPDIEVSEVEVHTPSPRTPKKKSNGAKTIPQIFIGEKHIGGYVELRALDRDGKLNSLLET